MLHKMTNQLDKCQLKFSSEDKGSFEGYASVFDSVDKVGDTIKKGAFVESLARFTPKMFVNHDHGQVPIGDWVEMHEDDTGLYAKGQIDLNHKDGVTVYSAMKRGAMDGLSIGFTMSDDGYESKGDGRIISSVNLMETSIVNFPCEGRALITGVKSADMDYLETLKDCENYLREAAGFSKSAAVAFVSRVKKHARSDSEVVFSDEIAKHNQEMKEEAISVISSIRKLVK